MIIKPTFARALVHLWDTKRASSTSPIISSTASRPTDSLTKFYVIPNAILVSAGTLA